MVTELQKKMGGWIVELVAPALIMIMTGSLTFFLMQVVYFGDYPGRVGWVLSLFIFASVLTSRISIIEGFDKAIFYGLFLGAATIFVLTTLSNLSFLLAIMFIGVIWWFNSKLTWDCTVIDNTRDSTDRGLLSRFGLRSGSKPKREAEEEDEDGSEEEIQGTSSNEKLKTTSWTSRFLGKKRIANTPGVWVLILSLAAFPIFGIGQGFLEDESRRQNAFFYFCTYLGAGLGLLVTTAMMGLQRYLQRRNATMPNSVALSWVGFGTLMILAILLAAWILPRPYAEYSVAENPFKFEKKSTWGSSRNSFGQEGKDDGRSGGKTDSSKQPSQSGDGKGKGQKGKGQKGKGQKGKGQSKTGSQKQSGKSGSNQSGKNKSSSGKGKSDSKNKSGGSNKNGKQQKGTGKNDSAGKQKGDQSKSQKNGEQQSGKSKSNQPGKTSKSKGEEKGEEKGDRQGERNSKNKSDSGSNNSKRKDEQSGKRKSEKQTSNGSNSDNQKNGSKEQTRNEDNERKQTQNSGSSSSKQNRDNSKKKSNSGQSSAPKKQSSSRSFQMPSMRGVLWILQWLVTIVVVIVAIYFIWKYRQQIWQKFLDFLKDLKEFWANLWSKRSEAGKSEEPATIRSKTIIPNKSFAEFSNPYQTGESDQWTVEMLVRYSFEALEAWGRERGVPRNEDQTPHEFALEMVELEKNIARSAKKLADFYCAVAFAKDRLDEKIVNNELRQLWSRMLGQPLPSDLQPA